MIAKRLRDTFGLALVAGTIAAAMELCFAAVGINLSPLVPLIVGAGAATVAAVNR